MMLQKIIIVLFVSSVFLISQSEIRPRIVNGTPVSSSDPSWSFVVSLQWRGNHYCGGSLIDSKWVLTAAHCLTDDYGDIYPVQSGDSVGIGSYDLQNMDHYEVKRFIVHPAYDPATSDNDIGLVELVQDAVEAIPVRYDRNTILNEGLGTKAAGWGNRSAKSEDYPQHLYEAVLPIIARSRCNAYNIYNGKVTSNMICAGYMNGSKDTCQGDSGGPLYWDGQVVGVVSWGYGCAQPDKPGVYTKVQNYATWIKRYIPSYRFVPIVSEDLVSFVLIED